MNMVYVIFTIKDMSELIHIRKTEGNYGFSKINFITFHIVPSFLALTGSIIFYYLYYYLYKDVIWKRVDYLSRGGIHARTLKLSKKHVTFASIWSLSCIIIYLNFLVIGNKMYPEVNDYTKDGFAVLYRFLGYYITLFLIYLAMLNFFHIKSFKKQMRTLIKGALYTVLTVVAGLLGYYLILQLYLNGTLQKIYEFLFNNS